MNTFLFDLDGTLLPFDMETFSKIYFYEISKYFSDMADGKELVNNILLSTEVMVKNTEHRINEEIFLEDFSKRIDGDIDIYIKNVLIRFTIQHF